MRHSVSDSSDQCVFYCACVICYVVAMTVAHNIISYCPAKFNFRKIIVRIEEIGWELVEDSDRSSIRPAAGRR